MGFEGFPDEAFSFYEGLTADNSKAYWTAHRATYESAVRAPMAELLAELEAEFGEGHLFRPYRDVRFSRDKSPYKDHQGGFVGVEDGVGYYVQVSAAGVMLAAGWYSGSPLQLAHYREAVAGPAGAVLETALAAAAVAGLTVGGDVMKTRPRGVEPDHPRLDLLRHRTLTLAREGVTETGTGLLGLVRADWRTSRPVVEWLADHVGPAEGQPAEPR